MINIILGNGTKFVDKILQIKLYTHDSQLANLH